MQGANCFEVCIHKYCLVVGRNLAKVQQFILFKFKMRGIWVALFLRLEKCTASAHHPSNLGNKAVPCWDTFSVPRYLFSLFRMRRPTTTSYRPILPAAIMLRAFLRL